VGICIGVWYYSGRNPKLYNFLSQYIPEKYLPEPQDSDSNTVYAPVPTNFGDDDDLQEDAPEIDLEDSDAH